MPIPPCPWNTVDRSVETISAFRTILAPGKLSQSVGGQTPDPVPLPCMTEQKTYDKTHPAIRTLAAVGVGAIVVYGARVLLNFFGPAIPYSKPDRNDTALDSEATSVDCKGDRRLCRPSNDYFFTTLRVMLDGYCTEW